MKHPIRNLALALGLLSLPAATQAVRAADDASTTATATADAADKEELKLELPAPMFMGTPTNIKSSNLEKITGKKRAAFMVPTGTVLLSAEKPVTAQDMAPVIGEVTMVTDGDKEGSDGSFVELEPGKTWVQIDLEQPATLAAILLWHYHGEARVYRDVVVQVSDDPEFASGVTTLYNNDHDNSSGLGLGKDKEYIETNEGRLIDAKGAKGRYLRFYSNGNSTNELNHYVEIEVYGAAQP